MLFTNGDVRTTSFHPKSTGNLRSGIKKYSAVEKSKDQFTRNCQARLIFDFCNSRSVNWITDLWLSGTLYSCFSTPPPFAEVQDG